MCLTSCSDRLSEDLQPASSCSSCVTLSFSRPASAANVPCRFGDRAESLPRLGPDLGWTGDSSIGAASGDAS